MALPKLNSEFKYEMVIPSTKETVSFRPYLVKEEKVLLMASESKSKKQMLKAMKDIIESCFQDIKVSKLTIFDIEMAFVNLRARSAGEVTEVGYECKECEHKNKLALNLLDVKVEFPEASKKKKIQITDDIHVEMRYPTLSDADIEEAESVEALFKVIDSLIEKVYTEEDVIDFHDETPEARTAFIESLNSEQFDKLRVFLEHMPSTHLETSFKCEACEEDNVVDIRGIQNFFG